LVILTPAFVPVITDDLLMAEKIHGTVPNGAKQIGHRIVGDGLAPFPDPDEDVLNEVFGLIVRGHESAGVPTERSSMLDVEPDKACSKTRVLGGISTGRRARLGGSGAGKMRLKRMPAGVAPAPKSVLQWIGFSIWRETPGRSCGVVPR
jgi:hypothetical protein